MSGVAGNYFFPGSSRFVAAIASVTADREFVVSDTDNAVLARAPLRRIRVSPRLGKLVRRIRFPDGGQFESADNDGVDMLLQGRLRKGTLVDRIERSLGWILASIATAIVTVALFLAYGVPAMALWLANETPAYLSATISRQALSQVDTFMKPSKLKLAERKRVDTLFRRIATQGKDGPKAYRLLFRDGGLIGANAFSLPDGTVVLTDQLYRVVNRDDELEGVFGHEIAHADRRHALQAVYQASLIPAAIAFATGDVTQVAHIATLLSGILIQTAYSRSLEQQADDDSARMMNAIGADPAALGELLERMEKKECGKTGCGPSWLGDHPDTAARAAKLRHERLQPPPK